MERTTMTKHITATRDDCFAGRPGQGVMAVRHLSGSSTTHGAADWLGLAAAPTFAIMALLSGVLGGGPPDMLCAAAPGASPLSGMVLMYLLMSAFHLAPWLKLISSRRSGARNGLNDEQPPRQRASET
jgi:hypothetical protein